MAESSREEIAKLEALYANNPGGRVFTHLAEAYRKAGELDRARKILEDGIARHADYASAQVVLGRVLLDLGESDDATVAFRRVLELDPENRVAVRALGDLAHTNGREAEALSHYRQLLTLDPTDEQLRRRVDELVHAPPPAAPSEPVPLSAEADPVTDSAEAVETVEAAESEPAERGNPLAPDVESASHEDLIVHEDLAIEGAADMVAPSVEQDVFETETFPPEQVITSDFVLGWDGGDDEQSGELPGDLARLMDGLEDPVGFDTPLFAEDPEESGSSEFDPGMPIDLGPRDEPQIENAGDFEVDLVAGEPDPEDASAHDSDFGLASAEAGLDHAPWTAHVDLEPANPEVDEPRDAAAETDSAEMPVAEPWETLAEADSEAPARGDEPWETAAEPDPWTTATPDEPWASADDEARGTPQAADEPWAPAGEEAPGPPPAPDEPWTPAASDEPWTPAASEEPWTPAAADESWTSAAADDPWTPSAADEEHLASADEQEPWEDAVDASAEEPEPVGQPEAQQDSEPSDWIVGDDAILDVVLRAEPTLHDENRGEDAVQPDPLPDEAPAPEPGFEALLSSSREDSLDDDVPQPTETLAELYRAQGFDDQAAAVYRALLAQRPGDARLEQKLADLEEGGAFGVETRHPPEEPDALESAWIDAGAQDLAEPSPFSWTEDAAAESETGPSIGDYFAALLAWKPANATGQLVDMMPSVREAQPAEEPSAEAAASAPSSVADAIPSAPSSVADAIPSAGEAVTGGAEAVGVEPWEQPAEMPVEPVQAQQPVVVVQPSAAASSGNPIEAAFDEWFTGGPSVAPVPMSGTSSGADSDPGLGGEGAPPSGQANTSVLDDGEDESDDDLEMFRSWLQSLKR